MLNLKRDILPKRLHSTGSHGGLNVDTAWLAPLGWHCYSTKCWIGKLCKVAVYVGVLHPASSRETSMGKMQKVSDNIEVWLLIPQSSAHSHSKRSSELQAF
eukprot:4116034-Amphidinium_carterae.1